ncbi:hypothetical protein [Daejeonella sp. H1SJ63]|uniref:OB-fold protein n=1 Tax=Daejeonella sp. H1SJ63 TaxID=3034145 RepID=UPI0023ECDE75|nr:hypothetical protein [Daejeonella sp. H1SJ63]
MKKGIKSILILILITVIGLGLYVYTEYNRKSKSIAETTEDFTISASDFLNEFQSGENKANAKFIGKTVLVSGILKTVEAGEKGRYTLVLGDKNASSSIRCEMDSTFLNKDNTLKEGNTVKIKGKCSGFIADDLGLGSDIILGPCIIVN